MSTYHARVKDWYPLRIACARGLLSCLCAYYIILVFRRDRFLDKLVEWPERRANLGGPVKKVVYSLISTRVSYVIMSNIFEVKQ